MTVENKWHGFDRVWHDRIHPNHDDMNCLMCEITRLAGINEAAMKIVNRWFVFVPSSAVKEMTDEMVILMNSTKDAAPLAIECTHLRPAVEFRADGLAKTRCRDCGKIIEPAPPAGINDLVETYATYAIADENTKPAATDRCPSCGYILSRAQSRPGWYYC
nr:hypothetical protein [Candidatus Sigynarchaeota archaeon]